MILLKDNIDHKLMVSPETEKVCVRDCGCTYRTRTLKVDIVRE